MSDHPEPPADVVELASRYCDGDLTADERAAAEADAEVMAWVARFGGVRAALREPITVDPAIRDAALAAALDAVGTAPPGAAPTGAAGDVAAPTVTHLAAARAQRSRRLAVWLGGVAAAAVLAIGGVVLFGTGGDDDSAAERDAAREPGIEVPSVYSADHDELDRADGAGDPASPPAAEADEAPSDASATSGSGGSRDGAAVTTASEDSSPTVAASSAGRELDRDALAALADALALTTAGPCHAEAAERELVAIDVTVDGRPAVVYRDPDTRVMTAFATDDCTVLMVEPYG